MTPVTARWSGVRERVRALGAVPGAERVFGAGGEYGGHRFVLLPPVGEDTVTGFEQAVGVRLPEDYRAYLLEVSAGGAGPYYGLIPFTPETMDAELLERLSAPFRPDVVQPLIDAQQLREPERSACPDEDTWHRAQLDWVQRMDDLGDSLLHGTLELSHQGCGYYDVLVLNGAGRGSLWEDDRAADQGVNPLAGDGGGPVTFTDWYLEWLERTEREVFGAP